MKRSLTDSWTLGGVPIPNRVVLAPLAGIGNWFVRLQAKRYGAGLVVSEMVSSFAVHYRNERTLRELLRIHPDEHPVSVQLFGHDPDVMASAAERVAAAGADLIDINMGCPVPEGVQDRRGRGAARRSRARGRAGARPPARGSGLPVTVKLRSGQRPGDLRGLEVARRLRRRGRSPAIAIHPRHASQRHNGAPDYELVRGLVEELPVPVLVSGGLHTAEQARGCVRARRAPPACCWRAGRSATRGCSSSCSGDGTPSRAPEEILAELDWVIDRAGEHLGAERAARYLRKFYPWYVERLGGDADRLGGPKALQAALQSAPTLEEARAMVGRAPVGAV